MRTALKFETFMGPMHAHFLRPDGWLHFYDMLDPPVPVSRMDVMGDPASDTVNLDYPWRISRLFYEDMDKADNFGDLELRIVPVARPDGQRGHYVVVFFCEGAYEKVICYQDRMIHHYEPNQPDMGRRNHYGIFATWDFPLKGSCPFQKQ